MYPVDDPEWRKWMNQHFYRRQGVGFDEMNDKQRAAAFGMLKAALSAKGLKLTQDIMKLNHTLGEMNNDNFVEYGEWLYYITVMGEPSAGQPWGWQLDGHHAIINYFVLGDQVVMTPLFVGSEQKCRRSLIPFDRSSEKVIASVIPDFIADIRDDILDLHKAFRASWCLAARMSDTANQDCET
jgi:hypothetical protein